MRLEEFMGAILSAPFALPGLALSAAASLVYALTASLWVATAGPREALLQGSRGVTAVVARAALQLLLSLVLSMAAYAALYAAFVPEAESAHPLHFGLCQPAAARGIGSNGGGNAESSSSGIGSGSPREDQVSLPSPGAAAARVARLLFETLDAPAALFAPATTVQVAATAGAATLVPPLARAYEYTVGVCIRLPESPPNLEAGTFVASIRVLSASNRTLLSTSRPLVLRYRSAQLKWMWTLFFALPLLFGWMDESQLHCTMLADTFTNLRNEPASRATVALVSPNACTLQVYDATIRFGARLGTITQLMSQYFFTAAALGVGLLMAVHWMALLLFEMRPNNFPGAGLPAGAEVGAGPGAAPGRDVGGGGPGGPVGPGGRGDSAGARMAAAAAFELRNNPRAAAAAAQAAANAAAAAQATANAAAQPRPRGAGAVRGGQYDQFLEEDMREEEEDEEDEEDDDVAAQAYFRTGDLYQGLDVDDGGLRQRATRS